uniref:Uncharacterized protein n=1 Tax=Lepeophtheirus salmonis TaxID=72036 RepID=A0A0K2UYY5_LEPSM
MAIMHSTIKNWYNEYSSEAGDLSPKYFVKVVQNQFLCNSTSILSMT